MNNSIQDHENLKGSNNILTSAMIDMQAFVALAPKIFGKDADRLPEFQNDRDYFDHVCSGILANVAKVREIIPVKKANELS